MSVITIDNDLVHYEAIGRGRPVVFVHGWLGSWRYWWPTMQAISAHQFRAYALDLWGFGDSAKRRERYGFESYVSLLGQFMDQLGLPATTLVGHSLGAAVALRYACEQPEWIERVMTVGFPLVGEVGVDAGTFVGRLTDRRNDWGYAEVESELPKTDQVALVASAQQLLSADLMVDLRTCGRPHLLVYGARDALIPPPANGRLADVNLNSRQLNLEQSRHFPMLDEAPKFARLLLDFVDAQDDLHAIELKEEWRRRTR